MVGGYGAEVGNVAPRTNARQCISETHRILQDELTKILAHAAHGSHSIEVESMWPVHGASSGCEAAAGADPGVKHAAQRCMAPPQSLPQGWREVLCYPVNKLVGILHDAFKVAHKVRCPC